MRDAWSHAWHRFAVWRQQGGNWRIVVFVAGMLILSWLGWRQLRGSRWRRGRRETSPAARQTRPVPGADSEFLEVVRKLETVAGPRLAHETPRAWIRRSGLDARATAGPLLESLGLHNRLRFDPAGLPAPDRNRLRELASSLLERVGGRTGHS